MAHEILINLLAVRTFELLKVASTHFIRYWRRNKTMKSNAIFIKRISFDEQPDEMLNSRLKQYTTTLGVYIDNSKYS